MWQCLLQTQPMGCHTLGLGRHEASLPLEINIPVRKGLVDRWRGTRTLKPVPWPARIPLDRNRPTAGIACAARYSAKRIWIPMLACEKVCLARATCQKVEMHSCSFSNGGSRLPVIEHDNEALDPKVGKGGESTKIIWFGCICGDMWWLASSSHSVQFSFLMVRSQSLTIFHPVSWLNHIFS
jgi:hypothetical protein